MRNNELPHRSTLTRRRHFLIPRKRECQNHATVDQAENVQKAPTKDASCAPINLIAQYIWDRHPEQAGQNQQISEHRYEQAAWLMPQKGCVQQWFRCEQAKNAKSAYREEFSDKSQHKSVANRQCNKQRAPERGKLTHLNCGEEPKSPDKTNSQKDDASHVRSWEFLCDVRKARFY
jgi:hypothetical protein